MLKKLKENMDKELKEISKEMYEQNENVKKKTNYKKEPNSEVEKHNN